MLELLSIKFQGIGRFVEEQEVILKDLPSIVGVMGRNKNTGGSSGAAKSTIFHAIDWIYGVNRHPTTILKSRYSKDMSVSGVFLWNGSPLTISRSTKSGLTIEWVDKEGQKQTISDNSALAEEKLDEILSLPRDLFRLSSHKRQEEGGFFLNLTPKQSFEFLIGALDLKEWQLKLEKLSSKVSETQKLVDYSTLILKTKEEAHKKVETSLEEAKARLEEAKKNKGESYKDKIEELEAQVKTYRSSLASLRAEYDQNIKKFKRPDRSDYVSIPDPKIIEELSSIESDIEDKKAQADKENEKNQAVLTQLNQKEVEAQLKLREISRFETEISSLTSDIVSKRKKIDHLESGKCHVCNQAWADEGSEKEIKNLKADVFHSESKINDLKGKIEKEPLNDVLLKIKAARDKYSKKVKPDTGSLEIQKRSLESKLDEDKTAKTYEYEAALHEHMDKVNNATKEYQEKKEIIDESLSKAETEIQNLKQREYSLNDNVRLAENEVKIVNKSFEEASEDYAKAVTKLVRDQRDYNLAEEARMAIKSYLMTIFEETLIEIGERASRTLSNLPNMNTATIYFEPFKEIASGPNKGKVKEEVTAILSVDGEVDVPIRSLSGGERASVDIAVDLAVVDMIEEKGGVGTNYLILDEPCQGMDPIGKQAYIDVLRSSGTKKKVLIVDHSSEIQEVVDDTIVAVREGIYSNIEA